MSESRPPVTLVTQSQKPATALDLGARLRAMRQYKGWSLDEASLRTGLAKSTLSKIENNKHSPTFEVMRKISKGLGINLPQLFAESSYQAATGRRSLTRSSAGTAHLTPTYEHELLATELRDKRMVPFKSYVRARDFNDFEDWVRHSGEEFLLVLQGEIVFYSEFYEPVNMHSGDNIYYDAEMGHVLISVSDEDAQVLWVCAPR